MHRPLRSPCSPSTDTYTCPTFGAATGTAPAAPTVENHVEVRVALPRAEYDALEEHRQRYGFGVAELLRYAACCLLAAHEENDGALA